VDFDWQWRFIAPNQLIEMRPDGFTILQFLPVGPGSCRLRSHHYTYCEDNRAARVARYLASRVSPRTTRSMIAVAESTQKGLSIFGDQTAQGASSAREVTAFRQYLLRRVPAMALDRPPADF
jgi:carnitine monooxygenase subunit